VLGLGVVAQGGADVGLRATSRAELFHGAVERGFPVCAASRCVDLAHLVQQVAPHHHAVRPGRGLVFGRRLLLLLLRLLRTTESRHATGSA
jgi:hypothetical protein